MALFVLKRSVSVSGRLRVSVFSSRLASSLIILGMRGSVGSVKPLSQRVTLV